MVTIRFAPAIGRLANCFLLTETGMIRIEPRFIWSFVAIGATLSFTREWRYARAAPLRLECLQCLPLPPSENRASQLIVEPACQILILPAGAERKFVTADGFGQMPLLGPVRPLQNGPVHCTNADSYREVEAAR